MRKIPSLFQRNYDTDRLVRDEVVPGCEWVLAGEGVPTRKWDGTSVLVRSGQMFKRYDAKNSRTPPPGFEPTEDKPNEQTGDWPGWVPCSRENHADWMHWKAWDDDAAKQPNGKPHMLALSDGTYELCGPEINKNPEGLSEFIFIRHGVHHVDSPRAFAGIRDFLTTANIEGIVWHHPDGRMAKIKTKDFGLKRK